MSAIGDHRDNGVEVNVTSQEYSSVFGPAVYSGNLADILDGRDYEIYVRAGNIACIHLLDSE